MGTYIVNTNNRNLIYPIDRQSSSVQTATEFPHSQIYPTPEHSFTAAADATLSPITSLRDIYFQFNLYLGWMWYFLYYIGKIILRGLGMLGESKVRGHFLIASVNKKARNFDSLSTYRYLIPAC